jgi:hypothetical protein
LVPPKLNFGPVIDDKVLAARIPQLQLDQAPAIKGHAGFRRVDTMRISWRR